MRKGQKGPSLRVLSHAKTECQVSAALSAGIFANCNKNAIKTVN
jgi:hypothetical protein